MFSEKLDIYSHHYSKKNCEFCSKLLIFNEFMDGIDFYHSLRKLFYILFLLKKKKKKL